MNYKETVFLPRTDFPMRAGLPKKEPEILEGWKQIDIYNLSLIHISEPTRLR